MIAQLPAVRLFDTDIVQAKLIQNRAGGLGTGQTTQRSHLRKFSKPRFDSCLGDQAQNQCWDHKHQEEWIQEKHRLSPYSINNNSDVPPVLPDRDPSPGLEQAVRQVAFGEGLPLKRSRQQTTG
jgi:hypothetical protein